MKKSIKGLTSFDAIETYREVCNHNPNNPDFYCKGKDVPPPQYASRVMPLGDLIYHNLDSRYRRKSNCTEKDAQKLQGDSSWKDHIKPNAQMTNGRGFAFITLSEEIQAIRNDKAITPDNLGKAIKDRLGLAHITASNIPLIEIHYPEYILKHTAKPTAFDGCPSLIYRSSTSDDNYGRTIHLEEYHACLPEMVHLDIPLTSDFNVTSLGLSRESNFNKKTFLQNYYCKNNPVCTDNQIPDKLTKIIFPPV